MNLNSTTDQSTTATFDLALSTWFFVLLHEHNVVGGLPNEFLSQGSAALLLFDRVLCDKETLAWELRFKDRWLSSELFAELQNEGLLRPVNMRSLLKESVLPMLQESGLAQVATETMAAEVAAIKRGARPSALRLPSSLVELNKAIFASLSLELPQAVLFQDKENYFKVPSPNAKLLPPSFSSPSEAVALEHQEQFVIAVRSLLPDFSLLPPLHPSTAAARALKSALAREKPMVLRYAFGDPSVTQETVLDFRLGAEFRQDDAKIDEPRKAQAWDNFKLLLKVRSETADVRRGVQKIVADVMEGRRTVTDVKRELVVHHQELLSHLPGVRSATFSVRLAGSGIFVGLLEALSHIPGPSAAFHVIEWFRAKKERQHYAALRRQYPLPFFWRDFRAVRHEQSAHARR